MLKFLLLFLLKSDERVCPKDGVFSVPNTSCRTYKICSQLGENKYDCPGTTLFDQRAERCVLYFTCPDTVICVNYPSGLYADPNYRNSSSYYIECVKNVYGLEVRYGECINGQIFKSSSVFPHPGSCQWVGVIPPNATESTPAYNITTVAPPLPTLIPIPSDDCQKEGTFPVYYSSCKTYMICKAFDFNFIQYRYQCPTTSLFDPWKAECVTNYRCLENICENQLQGSLHADPNGVDKSRYYQCAIDRTGNMIPLYLKCETGRVFIEEKKVCGIVVRSVTNSVKEDKGILQWISSQLKWMFGRG